MNAAFKAAVAEGLAFYTVRMQSGNVVEFVGKYVWDGGFYVDDSGKPLRDSMGNAVESYSVQILDETCEAHRNQVDEWWG